MKTEEKNISVVGIYITLMLITFLLICAVIKSTGNGNKEIKTEEIINETISYKQVIRYYTEDNDVYEIIRENDKFNVIKKRLEDCPKLHCDEVIITSYRVIFSDDAMREEYIFFNNFFKDNEQEIKLKYDDYRLNDYRLNHINAFVYNDESYLKSYITAFVYESISSPFRSSERGYFVNENEDGTYSIIVSMGERNTGGYSISLSDIELDGYNNILTLKVKETSPDVEAIVTMALTYPSFGIKISYLPREIKVVNVDNGYEFMRLN